MPHLDARGVQREAGGFGGGEGDVHELPRAAYAGGSGTVKRERSVGRLISDYMNLALILPVSLLVGYAIGLGLDRVFGTNFWYIVWLVAGVIAGMRELIRKLNKEFDRDTDSK
ncbi:MAG: hypothetical protein B7X34_01910 [Acidobacteriia bacterium 12-62-4]|nr:MAG: hypothetical protein B7X34_01910 [Acidobacteriia bacterium 12-62-4]